MQVALQKTSLIDYPDKLAAVIFFTGCNLRCPWCQNSQLALNRGFEEGELMELDRVMEYLDKRKAVLSAVVLSGGEALLHRELEEIIPRIKEKGFLVKIDTNGMCPDALERVFVHAAPDFISLDLKLAPDRYKELGLDGDRLIASARILAEGSVAHEYRSLVLPEQRMTVQDVESLAPLADGSPWYFAPFRGGNCLDPRWNEKAEPIKADAEDLVEAARALGKNAIMRGF